MFLTSQIQFEGENLTFSQNLAVSGGALWLGGPSVSVLVDCIFKSNQAMHFAGGAISLLDYSRLKVTKGSFLGNQARNGGAVFSGGSSFLQLQDTDFS
jgi:predicted outer membrane repeat protein